MKHLQQMLDSSCQQLDKQRGMLQQIKYLSFIQIIIGHGLEVGDSNHGRKYVSWQDILSWSLFMILLYTCRVTELVTFPSPCKETRNPIVVPHWSPNERQLIHQKTGMGPTCLFGSVSPTSYIYLWTNQKNICSINGSNVNCLKMSKNWVACKDKVLRANIMHHRWKECYSPLIIIAYMFLIWYQLCCLMKFARKELLHTFPPQVTNAQPIHVNECLRDQWDGFASIVGL